MAGRCCCCRGRWRLMNQACCSVPACGGHWRLPTCAAHALCMTLSGPAAAEGDRAPSSSAAKPLAATWSCWPPGLLLVASLCRPLARARLRGASPASLTSSAGTADCSGSSASAAQLLRRAVKGPPVKVQDPWCTVRQAAYESDGIGAAQRPAILESCRGAGTGRQLHKPLK